jgi:DNA-binding LacI/PurR family transcriptional regulator
MIDHSDVTVAPGPQREHERDDKAGCSRKEPPAGNGNSDFPPPAKTVCLQDIADRANVSRATVSLALRNDQSISLVTRARIQEIAAVLDYRPNPLVSALMTYQRNSKAARRTHVTLAILLRWSRRGRWRSQVSESLLQASAARAQQHGYRLEEFWLDDLELGGRRLEEVLYARAIPGVLVAPSVAPGDLRLDWSRLSAVAVGPSLLRPQLHRVSANCLDGMRLALRRLRRLGYQRIGLALKASHDARADGHWSAGFLSEQQQLAPAQRVPIFMVRDECWTERNFGRWYANRQPDAILSHEAGVIPWLEKLGRRVPDDAGFVQLSVEDGCSNCTGIELNSSGMGTVAVDLLVEMIRRNERGVPASPQTVLLETCWVEGGTTRRRSLRPAGCDIRGQGVIDGDIGFDTYEANGRGRWTLVPKVRQPNRLAEREFSILQL